jgi:subtilisin family serine protease
LPPGKYLIRGFGASANVKSGRFDFYLPEYYAASFGRGVEKKYMVGSPGNASNAITVGAYDFRNTWENLDGKWTTYNMDIGRIAAYSSPGFRLDGFVKPDITAPATYTISSLAKDSNMSKDRSGQLEREMITRDGYHLAWSGTSAATPYVVGVIALMLEKNPTLDAKQIRDIITRTAKADSFTRSAGQVPNPEWGYGKIDPAAALRATPAKLAGSFRGNHSAAAKATRRHGDR